MRPFPGWIQVQPAFASVSSVTALPSAVSVPLLDTDAIDDDVSDGADDAEVGTVGDDI